MSKATDSGKAFLDSVLAKLPENLRADAEKAFTAPEAADALTVIGDGVLARADYSKKMDDLASKEAVVLEDFERNQTWFEQNKERLGKVETLEATIARLQGQKPPEDKKPDPPTAPDGYVTRDDLLKIINEREQGFAGFSGLTNTLSVKHYADFHEVLDMNAVIAHATKKRLPLLDGYKDLYAEQIKAKADAEEKARIDKLVEERLTEEKKKLSQPFPLRNQQPSVLDVIEQKGDPSQYTADAAAAEYERLQAART